MKAIINKIPVSIGLCLLLTIMCAITFWDFLIFQKLYLFKDIGSDTLNLFYPHLLHITDYLQTEGIPKWSFNQGIGQNITNSGIDNPFNWPLYWAGSENLAYVIIYVEVLKIILCGLVTYHWLCLLTKSKKGAFWGGLCFAFSGYVIVGSSWYVHSYFCLTTVFLLLAFELGYQLKNWLLMPLAAFLAFGVNALFLAQFMLIYLVFRLYINQQFNLNQFIKVALKAIPFAMLGVLFKAPFLGSLFSRIINSPRVLYTDILSFDLAGSAQYYGTLFLRFIGNDWQGNGSEFTGWVNYLEAPLFYVGIPTLIMAMLVFFIENKRIKKAFIALFAFWLLLLLVPFLRYTFYWFSGDYFKNALSCFVPLTIIMAASFALKQFAVKRKVLLYAAFACLILDLSFTAYNTVNKRDALTAEEFVKRAGYNDYTLEAINYLQEKDTGFYRIQKKYPSTWAVNSSLNDAKVFNFFGTSAYASFNQSSYTNFLIKMDLLDPNKPSNLKWITGIGNRENIADLLGVKYLLYQQPLKNHKLQKIKTWANIDVYENPRAKPLGFTMQHYLPMGEFEMLDESQQDCAINKAIIAGRTNLKDRLKKLDTKGLCNEPVSNFKDLLLTEFSQNKITFKGNTTGGMFFTSIPFDGGWKATIFENEVEKEVQIERVNFGFVGIPINAQTTGLVLEFVPPFYYIGWIVAILAFVLYGFLIIRFYLQRSLI